MSLQSTAITTTLANIYASTGNTCVTTVYIANYSTSSNVTFNLYAVASAGSASNTNKIYSNVTVLAGDTYIIDSERLLLDNGDMLKANCNANSICSSTVTFTTI
jgi:hypothetical protein